MRFFVGLVVGLALGAVFAAMLSGASGEALLATMRSRDAGDAR
jgi:hypothetical protein